MVQRVTQVLPLMLFWPPFHVMPWILLVPNQPNANHMNKRRRAVLYTGIITSSALRSHPLSAATDSALPALSRSLRYS